MERIPPPRPNLEDALALLRGPWAPTSSTRGLIDSTDGKRVWGAVGENIIEASWQALVDGLEG